nr:PREDICTED: zinc finger protein 346 isoform X1 [Lepisosteus oculatus]
MADGERNGDLPAVPSGLEEVNKMISEHSHLFSDTQCKVCSALLISESQKLAHYQSKKHANKVRRYMSIHQDEEPSLKRFKGHSSDNAGSNGVVDRNKACSICNMTFSSPVMAESHYQGKVHAKTLKLKTQGFQAAASSPPPAGTQARNPPGGQSAEGTQGSAEGDPDRFCVICHACFNNPLMARQHYVGKKHKKQTTKMKLLQTYGPSSTPASTVRGYPCTICNIELNSVEQYQAHISGSKHKLHAEAKKRDSALMPLMAQDYKSASQSPKTEQSQDRENCSQ